MTRLMSPADVAEMLDTTVEALYVRRHRGQLPPAVRIAGRLYWRPADIERWIDQHVEPAADARRTA